jgi:hypothetical protein
MGFLVVLVVAGAIWALIYVPKWQVPVCPPGQDSLPPKICFDIENEARRTLAYILAGILAIFGIYMAHRRIRAIERQVLVAQEGQITERFTRAIEQLGSDKMEIRLGGIYALERIANDSDNDYWPIIETLTAYVRYRAPWQEPSSTSSESVSKEESEPNRPTPGIKPPTAIQAILTVLGRRKYRYGQREEEPLNLRETDLRGADLSKAHLEDASLSRAHLERANLIEAHLQRANFQGTHFERAIFLGCYLENAFLSEAHLEGATLVGARLQGAYLKGTHLEGSDLSDARGLTRQQLAEAIIDEKTILPDYLQEETQEGKGPEGDKER